MSKFFLHIFSAIIFRTIIDIIKKTDVTNPTKIINRNRKFKIKNTPIIILLSVNGIIKILLFILCHSKKNTNPVRIVAIEKYFMFLKLNSIYFSFFNLITSLTNQFTSYFWFISYLLILIKMFTCYLCQLQKEIIKLKSLLAKYMLII